ncbi:MAG TPA: hypothetical protein PK347_09930 [Burkholderiaceae bacterium]|nr:hypothetical protein [Burkholderiaceae bacterium]
MKAIVGILLTTLITSCFASGETETVEPVQIQGITIINNKLWIDGVEVKKGTKVYTSQKSKTKYQINWDDNGNIAVKQVKQ